MRIFQLQRISAIALLIFMTIHMIVVHYPPFHIDFSRIVERMDQPIWKAIDIVFLFFVLVHALTGAYMVLTDLGSFSTSSHPCRDESGVPSWCASSRAMLVHARSLSA